MTDKVLLLKRLIGYVYSFFTQVSAERKIILIYHSVHGGPVSTHIDGFQEQMAWLSKHAEVVSLDVLLNESQREVDENRPKVALTFDDGYRTLFDTVAPILDEHGFPATVYLNTGEISDGEHKPSLTEQGHYPGEQFMLWSEVTQLHKQRWTIGSHGVHHVDLCLCDEKEIEHQLVVSKVTIEKQLGEDCEHFSYTWGHNSDVVRNAVKSAGYSSAVAGMHSPVVESSDVFELPRLDVRNDYSLDDFVAVVTGKWDYLKFTQSLRSLFR